MTRRAPKLVAGLVLAAVTLGACGGDDDAASATTVASATTPAPSTTGRTISTNVASASSAPATTSGPTSSEAPPTTVAPTETSAPETTVVRDDGARDHGCRIRHDRSGDCRTDPADDRDHGRAPRAGRAATATGERGAHRARHHRDPEDRRRHDDVRGHHADHARPRARPLARHGDARAGRQRRRRRSPHQPATGRSATSTSSSPATRSSSPPPTVGFVVPRCTGAEIVEPDRDVDRRPRPPAPRRRCSPCHPPGSTDERDRRPRCSSPGVTPASVAAVPRGSRMPALAGPAVIVALSLPPWGFWPLAFVGSRVFELALGDAPDRAASGGRAGMAVRRWPGCPRDGLDVVPDRAGLHRRRGALRRASTRVAARGRPPRAVARHRPAGARTRWPRRCGFCFPFGGVPLATLGDRPGRRPVRSAWLDSAA